MEPPSEACDHRFYIYIQPPVEPGWDYAGGGALHHIWKQLDENGFITQQSDKKELTFRFDRRGPIFTVEGFEFLLQNRDIIVVSWGPDWTPLAERGPTALYNLNLSEIN